MIFEITSLETILISKLDVNWIADQRTKLISDCRKHVLGYRTRLYPPTQNEIFYRAWSISIYVHISYLSRVNQINARINGSYYE